MTRELAGGFDDLSGGKSDLVDGHDAFDPGDAPLGQSKFPLVMRMIAASASAVAPGSSRCR